MLPKPQLWFFANGLFENGGVASSQFADIRRACIGQIIERHWDKLASVTARRPRKGMEEKNGRARGECEPGRPFEGGSFRAEEWHANILRRSGLLAKNGKHFPIAQRPEDRANISGIEHYVPKPCAHGYEKLFDRRCPLVFDDYVERRSQTER